MQCCCSCYTGGVTTTTFASTGEAPVVESEKVEEPEVVDATSDKNTELAVVSTQKKKTTSSKIASALAAIIGTATTAAGV